MSVSKSVFCGMEIKKLDVISSIALFSFTFLSVDQQNKDKNYIRDVFNKFPDFFIQAFKIVVDSENSICYCYTSYEMTDQFLWFHVQMNSYSSNWNTPY